ncbi:MAG: VanW family protein [Saprospiraceae bacterium]
MNPQTHRAENLYRPTPRTWSRRAKRMLGRYYYSALRYLRWMFGPERWAHIQDPTPLPALLFAHATPIYRPLPRVEMRLQQNKATNLRIAAQRIEGLILEPGQTFSFWRRVGRPSRRKGYLPGLALSEGRVSQSTGGGLCQMGNLLHWMALHSPLTVAERWRHSYDAFPDIRRSVPFGSGATLAYNYVDLQLRNDSEQRIQLRVWTDAEYLHGEIRADCDTGLHYEVYERDHQIRMEPWGGYSRHNLLCRRIRDARSGALLADEPLVENHALLMYQPFLTEISDAQ